MNKATAQDLLIKSLSAASPLSAELQQALRNEFTFRAVPKRQRIKEEGGTNHYLHFVVKGLVKGAYDRGDKEGILWFAREGQFALLPDSFFSQAPTDEYIEAIEDCQLFRLSFEQLEDLHCRFPEMERLARVSLRQQLVAAGQRERMRRHPSPQVRLRHFMRTETALARRLHRYEIADYLRISRSMGYRSVSWNSLQP